MATVRFSDASGVVIEAGSGAVLQVQFDDATRGRVVADLAQPEADKVLDILMDLGVQLDRLVHPAPLVRGPNRQSASLTAIREEHPNAYKPWTTEDEYELKRLFYQGVAVKDIAAALRRQPGGIRSRLKKLGLID